VWRESLPVVVRERVAIVRAFMGHHQGMTIVAVADALLGGAMRARFHAEPMIKATELLLQERMRRDVAATRLWAADVKSASAARDVEPSGGRRFASVHQATPATHLLSNGRYSTMLTAAGSGYSRWGDLALARGRDLRRLGLLYLCQRLAHWRCMVCGLSIQRRRTGERCRHLRGGSRRDHALRRLADDDFGRNRLGRGRCRISPGIDHEFRKAPPRPRDHFLRRTRLAPQNADVAHPAFSKLFVETEYLPDLGAILATRSTAGCCTRC
jgi:cyclic beta-1,2-glucan synthetase